MRYLITGGAGFIGSNLLKKLGIQGHEVFVVDDLSTGDIQNMYNSCREVKFIQKPVAEILKVLSLKNLDGIFHLGIPSTTKFYRENHELTATAVQDFIKMLKLAKRENCKLVYASSSSIYNGNTPAFTENMPVKIKDFYTESRYFMERMAQLYFDFYKTQSIGLRFFSVYGPGEEAKKDFANLVSQFLWAMQKNEIPKIFGDGSQTRDFIYIDDVVQGLILAMSKPFQCHIFNIGTGQRYSLNELIWQLNQALGTNIQPSYQPNLLYNYVQDTQADITRATKELGFIAQVSLKQGIQKLIRIHEKLDQ